MTDYAGKVIKEVEYFRNEYGERKIRITFTDESFITIFGSYGYDANIEGED